jgi:hypothetical protein
VDETERVDYSADRLERVEAKLDVILVQIARMEPFLDMFDNPPPMLAGLMGGRKAKKAAKVAANGDDS